MYRCLGDKWGKDAGILSHRPECTKVPVHELVGKKLVLASDGLQLLDAAEVDEMVNEKGGAGDS